MWLDGHVTGDGLVAALLLCGALHGRPLAEVASVMSRYPQARENVPVASRRLTPAIEAEVDRINAELGDAGRVLVRPSGTEPVIRVLAEAEGAQEAESLCGRIAALVRRELG
jgi:phosphoglucosamine mutase